MYPPIHDTAILLFSRSAAEEAAAKPLAGTIVGRRAVAGQLIRHARSVAREAGFSLFCFSTRQQQGATFGERLANACEYVFSQGFSKVIAIGNDCPSLTANSLRLAAEKLATRPVVLGPATDGGAYLIGMHQTAYQRDQFLAIPWQTDRVFDALYALCNGVCHTLPEKSDVDSLDDLEQQLRCGLISTLLKIKLLQLLHRHAATRFFPEMPVPKATLLRCPSLRAPPLCAA